MERKMNYSKLIDRYLDGDMDEKEKLWFEKELQSDSNIARDLELHREVNKAIRESDVLKLRSQLDEIHHEIEPEYQKTVARKVIQSKYSRIAAASVVVLFTLGMLLGNLLNQPLTADQLFEKYYEVPEVTAPPRSDVEIDLLYQEALEYYSNEQFGEAMELFEKVIQLDNTNMEAHMAVGISNIETNKPRKAKESFTMIIEQEDNLYFDQARWYLGLCYLKMDNVDEAQSQFILVATDDRSNLQTVAKKILKELD
jgi:tetratricopeptide (TPR) repeat protein